MNMITTRLGYVLMGEALYSKMAFCGEVMDWLSFEAKLFTADIWSGAHM
jgi:hypothetical protein